MTMNNSKKYGIVLLINIGLLVFFIFSCYLYNHRQVLMDTTFYYEIPVIDKVLTINTPVFNDYAYVRIETNKSYTLKKCADLKIVRRETTDVSLIFHKKRILNNKKQYTTAIKKSPQTFGEISTSSIIEYYKNNNSRNEQKKK